MDQGVSNAIHLLQQKNSQLRNKVEALEEEVSALQDYLTGMSALTEATANIAATQDNLYKLLDEILYQALHITNTGHGSLLLVDEETSELVFVLVHGEYRDALQGYRMNWHQGIAGWVVEHGDPLIVNQAHIDPRFSPEIDKIFGMKTHDILAVPLKHGKRIMGVIELLNKQNETEFNDSDEKVLSLFGSIAAMSLAHLEEKLELADNKAV